MSENELPENKSIIKHEGYNQQSFDHLNILNQAAAGIMPTGPGVNSNSYQSKNEIKERNEELFKEIEKESTGFLPNSSTILEILQLLHPCLHQLLLHR